MNRKILAVVVGGLAFYVVQFAVSMATGAFIHEGVLEPLYMAHESFWRPELVQDPPDMAALMPRWITVGLINTLVATWIYLWLRPAFAGAQWLKGLKYGFVMAVMMAMFDAAWSGIFNLPDAIWFWWAVEGFFYFMIGGIALGWVVGRLAPEEATP